MTLGYLGGGGSAGKASRKQLSTSMIRKNHRNPVLGSWARCSGREPGGIARLWQAARTAVLLPPKQAVLSSAINRLGHTMVALCHIDEEEPLQTLLRRARQETFLLLLLAGSS